MADASQERVWEKGWEGHSLAQLRRLARLPLSEKLDWLEEAQRLANRLTARAAPPTAPATPGEDTLPPAGG